MFVVLFCSIYRNVCRSLFEKDKLLFSFLLCIGILKGRYEAVSLFLFLVKDPRNERKNSRYTVHFMVQFFLTLTVSFSFFFRSGKIDEQEWRFLLTGGVALENKFPNPASDWLTDKSWAEMVRCSALPSFKGILQHFTEHVSFGICVLFRLRDSKNREF